MSEELLEKLAELEHERWSLWMKYLFSRCEVGITQNGWPYMAIPSWCIERWTRQMNTPYSELSEDEKESDRIEARKTLVIINKT